MTNTKILIVQPEDPVGGSVADCLEELGYAVWSGPWPESRSPEPENGLRPDLALVDLDIEGGPDGVEAARRIGSRFDIPVVYLTSDTEGSRYRRSRTTRPYGYVLKPFGKRQLHLTIRTALSLHERERGRDRTIDDQRHQLQLMRTIFDSIGDGVLAADHKAEYVMLNKSASQFADQYGQKPDVDVDRRPRTHGFYHVDGETLFSPDELPLSRALRGKETNDVEFFVRNPKTPARDLYFSATGRPLQVGSDGRTGGVVIFRDITRLKRAEAELKQTVAKLQEQTRFLETVYENMNDGVIVADVEGRVLFNNSSAERILGMVGADLQLGARARTFQVFHADKSGPIPGDDLPVARALRGVATDDLELFVRNEAKPDGVFVRVSARPLSTDDGRIYAAVVIIHDITERLATDRKLKRTVDDLQRQKHLMETVLDSMNEGVAVADSMGRVLLSNRMATEIVGKTPIDSDPDEWSREYGVFYPDKKTSIPFDQLPITRAMRGETVEDMQVFIRNDQKPEGVFIRVSGRPLLNEVGGVRGGVIIFRDVTEKMMAEEALVRAFAQGRLEIVGTVLHDIGNAINSVTTGMETIYRRLTDDVLMRRLVAVADGIGAHRKDWVGYVRDDPQGRHVLSFVVALAEDFRRQREAMVKTVTRVRDRAIHISEIVRNQRLVGTPTMSRKYINLAATVSSAVKVLQDTIDTRGIEVDIDCGAAPREILTQESQFHQMLVNLIKNSIEAIDSLITAGELRETPRIQIRSYVKDEFLHLEVTDNGVGIDKLNPKVLFAAGYTTKKSGTGLGLHSIANFVIGSGGQISPLSAGRGQGTTMRVKLRLSSVSPENEI